MTRQLLLLSLLLAALVAADGWLRRARAATRVEAAVLRPLVPPQPDLVAERVRQLRLQAPGQSPWVYERRGKAWRFPAYFGAYAHGDRVDRLLRMALGASGTLARTDLDDGDELGLSDLRALRLSLHGSAGDALAEVWIGSGIPGPGGEESYARRAGSDSVLHLHANPQRLLGAARPPMLDPGLLPRAEARGATVEVTVTHGDGSSYRLRRVAAPIPEDAPPVPLPVDDRQRYRWILETGEGRVDSCVDASVYAYLAYLRQVQVDRLVDPAADDYGFTGSGVVMTDDEGLRHVIEVGRQTEEAFVRNVSAGLTSVLPVSRASWLTPSASVLLDSLPQPSPFDTARR